MKPITLYNYFRSSTSYRVRIALELKKIPYEYKSVHLLKNEQRSEEYLKINPLGGVPSLVQDGKVISESLAILEYLEQVYPDCSLLPKDPYLQAKVRQFCETINAFTHPMSNLKTLKYLETHEGYTQEDKEEWIQHWTDQGLETLETLAKQFSGTYCFGEQVTFADLLLVPQLFSAARFKVDLKPYPTLVKINDNCLQLEAFKKAHPFRQVDTPEEFREK